MSNSKLATVTVKSPNHSGQRTYEVTRITPHCMVGQLTAKRCGELFAKSSYQASSNYGIGKDGEIGLYVDEKNRSWCSSSADNDNRAITIECASDTKHPYAMNEKVWDSLVNLCIDICQRYGKKRLIWFNDKNTSLKYKPADDEIILTVHRWFAAKSCPGDWLYKRLGNLAEIVTFTLQNAEEAGTEKEVEAPNTDATSAINNEEPDRAAYIWNFLRGKGLNEYAVAGLMGNLYWESSLRPNNLQNSYEKKLGMTDKGYTNAVNDGSYTNFVHDSAGYGLAQWTFWSRKQNLLNWAKGKKASIDDLDMQLDFLWWELGTYEGVMKTLMKAKSVKEASDAVITGYEKPADQSSNAKKKRANIGQEYFDRVSEAGKAETAAKIGQKSYYVQFRAFSHSGNAAKRLKEVIANGYTGAQMAKFDGYYRVFVGYFVSVADTQELVTMARSGKYNVVVKERVV